MVRRRVVSPSPPPPDFYYPPKLGGDPDVPRPAVTRRTAAQAKPHEVTINGVKGVEFLPYGLTRVVAGADAVLYSFKPTSNEFWYLVPLGAGEVGNLISVKVLSGSITGSTPFSVFPTNALPLAISAWYFNGAASQTAAPQLAAIDPTWNETLAGSAYLLVRLAGLPRYWKSGVPTLEVIYEGLKCLDPRDGVTRYTTNTVLQLYDFVRRREGKALSATIINTASVIAGANIADELMADGSRRYSSNVTVREVSDVDDWLKVFRLLCDGFFTWRQNQFHLVLDRPGASTASYGDAHRVDEDPQCERNDPAEIVNHVRVVWMNPAASWQEIPHDEETDAVLAGTAPRVTATYRLPWIHDAGRAKRLAVFLLNSYQFDFRLRIRWAATTTQSAVGDLVTQTVTSVGIAEQVFRVLSRALQSDNSYFVELGEYSPAKYSDAVVTTPPKIASTAPDGGLEPPDIPLVFIGGHEELYEEQSGTVKTRGVFSWTPPDYPFYEAVELYRDFGEGVVAFIGEYRASPAVVPLEEVQKPSIFVLKVRDQFGRRSAGTVITFVAQGKLLPPTNVPFVGAAVADGRVSLRWQKSIDLDLIGYEVRRLRDPITGTPSLATLQALWAMATPVAKVDTLHHVDEPPFGSHAYLVCAYDSGKRYSPQPAWCNVTVDSVPRFSEMVSPLIVHHLTPGLTDYRKGTGNLVAEGVNSQRLQFILSRDTTFDEIATEMAAKGLATLDDYDTSRGGAELCFPLPTNASGTIRGMGAVTYGTATRNIDYNVRLAKTARIGRSSAVDSHAIAEPFCGDQFGSRFTAGRDGLGLALGLHLSSNDPWAQVIVRAEGEPIFFINYRRVFVPLGEYSGVTGADGRLTITLPPAMQLGPSQVIATTTSVTSTSFVHLVTEEETNTSFRVRAYSATGTPLPGIEVRASVEDRGRGGLFTLVIV